MNLNQVMMELDNLFAQGCIAQVPQFLEEHIEEARAQADKDSMLTLYNECIGFYRETGSYDKSIENCQNAIALMEEMGLNGTMPYATTLLNIANAYRAAGRLEESLAFYNQVRPIYLAKLKEDDLYFAGLYNNLSLLYQEMGDFGAAKEQLENALDIVAGRKDTRFETAVTQANLANTCIELGQDEEAKQRAEEAIRIFEELGVDDAHYSAALSALGSLYYMDKDYLNALDVMEKSRECVAKYLGAENIQYQRLSDNIEIIKEKMSQEVIEASMEDSAEEVMETPMETSRDDQQQDAREEEAPLEDDEIDKILGIDIDNEGWASVIRAEKGKKEENRESDQKQEETDTAFEEEADMKDGERFSPADSVSRFDINQAFANIKAAAKGKLQERYFDKEQDEILSGETGDNVQNTEHASDTGETASYDEDKAVNAMIAKVMDEIAFEVEEDIVEEETPKEEETTDKDVMEPEYTEETLEESIAAQKNTESEDAAQNEYAKIMADTDITESEDAVQNEHAKIMEDTDIIESEDVENAETEENAEEEQKASENIVEKQESEETAAAEETVKDNAETEDIAAAQDIAVTEETVKDNAETEDIAAAQDIAVTEETAKDNAETEDIAAAQGNVLDETYEDLTPDITGLELCRKYYEEYGKPMIAEKFAQYESRIAVGLVGKGSDCFGFDDIQSRDHDFGPRFILWVTKEVYDQIGDALETEYEKLPDEFMGVKRIETFHGRDRAGVMVIEDFYKNTLGFDLIGTFKEKGTGLTLVKSWLAVHDYALAAAVNGAVFRDDEGIFTSYREKLKQYYPKAVWYRKIAQACALFSQNGQYNLPRMRKRGQLVAAELAKAECIKQAMKLYYLLNRTYAPHDKWLFKAMPDNPQMVIAEEETGTQSQTAAVKTVSQLVSQISLLRVEKADEEALTMAVESLAVIFANELERQNLVGSANLYLDANTAELTAKSDALLTAVVANAPTITALSLTIAKAEFEAFDKVHNEGGRASCQNNWPTFKVMRMSQYMTWTEDMLLQYLYEFKTNYANGRNMIEEKYARMMASTAPEEYAAFADRLPKIPEEKQEIMEQIIDLQVKWMEEFAAEYPRLAGNARTIHTTQDLPYDTSYETYLRGELGTYSDKMLEMYGRYVVDYAKSGKSIAREIMANTVKFYGYKSFDEAESKGVLGQ